VIRTQIQLTEDQAHGLKRKAAERGVSMAEVIREAVDRVLAEDGGGAKRRRALAGAGRFRSGHADISERHDDYLAEDLWDDDHAG
jgi:Arc/MetJ-type ribon-helix-helix transcriptional regulator